MPTQIVKFLNPGCHIKTLYKIPSSLTMQISLTLLLLSWKCQHLDLKKAIPALPFLPRSFGNVSAPAVLPWAQGFLERTDALAWHAE